MNSCLTAFTIEEKKPIAIAGAGGIVKDAHLPAYRKAGFETKVIYDLKLGKAEELASQYNIPIVTSNLEEFVNLAQDHNCIFDLALPAQASIDVLPGIPDGAGVLIQKPMGENLNQAQQILEICREKQLIAGINFQLRHAPYIRVARKLISEGKIGKLHDIEIKICVYTPWHMWEFLYELPRVEILYHSIHYIDLVRFFWGNPKSVYAKTVKHPNMKELADTKSTIILDYGELKRATINTNHGHEYGSKHQESYIKFEGTEGAIKIRMGVNLNYPSGRADIFECVSPATDNKWETKEIEGTWFPDAFIGPMAGLMKKLNNSDYNFDNKISDAIHTMEVAEAAYISSKKGGVKPLTASRN